MKYCKRVTARVHLDAIRQNISNICRGIPQNTKVCAVVKADGYGHGATAIAQALDDTVDFFAVATVSEAVDLRAGAVKKPILILGYAWPEDYEELIEKDVRFTVFKEKDAKELSELGERMGKKALIHIKVDTGMNRIGFPVDDEAVETVRRIRTLPGVEVEGIFTHFARADEEDKTYAYEQLRLFQDFIRRVEKDADRIPIHHCANSAATLLYPATYLDMVRPGIVLYGHFPDRTMDPGLCDLVPVLELKSRVATVRTVPAGTPVSYGRTHTLQRDSRLAVIPIGYGDGYCRGFSNRITVLLHGKNVPVTGRICMDMCMVDVTDLPDVKEGDVAILYGSDQTGSQPVEAGAEIMNTISYELLCVLTKRIPRIYL